MASTYRAFMLWLIAIALPLQGIAAVEMQMCTPAAAAVVTLGGSHQAEPVLGRVVQFHAHATAKVSGHAHGHGHGQPTTDHPATYPVVSDLDDSGHLGHGMLKCCSAACSLAAYFSPSVAKHSRMPSLAPEQVGATFYPDVFLDGLDRPPRSFLACT